MLGCAGRAQIDSDHQGHAHHARGARTVRVASSTSITCRAPTDFPAKPEPDVILASLRAFGAEPEECLFVGDSPADMEAGRRAGVQDLRGAVGLREPRGDGALGTRLLDRASAASYVLRASKFGKIQAAGVDRHAERRVDVRAACSSEYRRGGDAAGRRDFVLGGRAQTPEPVEIGALHHAFFIHIGAQEAAAIGLQAGGSLLPR